MNAPNIDIVPPSADFSPCALVVLPCMLVGSRSGSKTAELRIPEGLPPEPLRALLPGLRIVRVEGLRPGAALALQPDPAATPLAPLAGARVTRWMLPRPCM